MSNLEAENKVQDSESEVDSNNEHAFVKPEVSVLAEELVIYCVLSQVFVTYAVTTSNNLPSVSKEKKFCYK